VASLSENIPGCNIFLTAADQWWTKKARTFSGQSDRPWLVHFKQSYGADSNRIQITLSQTRAYCLGPIYGIRLLIYINNMSPVL